MDEAIRKELTAAAEELVEASSALASIEGEYRAIRREAQERMSLATARLTTLVRLATRE